jgi:hypothetical protein
MIVYDLICTHQHRFEGWFASADDFARQSEGTLVRCPICDDAVIERRPSVNVQVPKRSIRGQATREEAAELRDEGIDFMSLPNLLTRDLN